MPTVRLLRPVDVIDDHGVLHAPGWPRRRTILALLALQPQAVVNAERILGAAWNGFPPDSGLWALRFHIGRLRAGATNTRVPLAEEVD